MLGISLNSRRTRPSSASSDALCRRTMLQGSWTPHFLELLKSVLPAMASPPHGHQAADRVAQNADDDVRVLVANDEIVTDHAVLERPGQRRIGRASCRERV